MSVDAAFVAAVEWIGLRLETVTGDRHAQRYCTGVAHVAQALERKAFRRCGTWAPDFTPHACERALRVTYRRHLHREVRQHGSGWRRFCKIEQDFYAQSEAA
jgi:hypothetical protein